MQSLLFLVFPQRIGCATTGLQPINIITSECSKSLKVYGGASNPKLCLYATTEVAIQSLVFPSPLPPKNVLPICPANAISSVAN